WARAEADTVAALDAGHTLILTLGHPSGVDQVMALPEFKNELGTGLAEAVIVTPVSVPEGIPAVWYGYDAAEVIVLDTNDPAAMEALDLGKHEALRQWVRNGGHLVVAVGDRWQAAVDSFLGAGGSAPLLPARPAGQVPLSDFGALESFAGSNKPLVTPENPAVAVTRLEPLAERGGRALDLTTGTPLVVRGHYGFGRVTAVGLNVDQRPFVDWADRHQFWVRVLDLRHRAAGTAGGPGGIASARAGVSYGNQVTDLATILHEKLERIRGVRPVPFGWVAFFVFLYILLIGPGDYLFLKKVLKRMELTWVTFPTIVLGVSLLAYVAAYRLKGTELRINQVDVVDLDTQPLAGYGRPLRGSTWATVFSPRNSDYDVRLVPLVRVGSDAANDGGWLDEAAAGRVADDRRGARMLLSWFGVPENQFAGYNASTRGGLASSSYLYEPSGDPDALRGLRIPIWDTKSLAGRWFAPGPAPVTSDLRRVGTDRLEGTITNGLSRPLDDAILAFGPQVYKLGTIAPGQTVRVETAPDQNLSSYLEAKRQAIPNLYPWQAESPDLDRVAPSDIVRVLMFHRSLAARGPMLRSHPLGYLDLTGQLDLDRPILVADVAAPAAVLDLAAGGTGSPPRIDRTTLVRVLLPLDQDQDRDQEQDP
ncbi:MAG TPA: hypothetical protein VF590_09280, partial [Isosphaeraceae bacterium]